MESWRCSLGVEDIFLKKHVYKYGVKKKRNRIVLT